MLGNQSLKSGTSNQTFSEVFKNEKFQTQLTYWDVRGPSVWKMFKSQSVAPPALSTCSQAEVKSRIHGARRNPARRPPCERTRCFWARSCTGPEVPSTAARLRRKFVDFAVSRPVLRGSGEFGDVPGTIGKLPAPSLQ